MGFESLALICLVALIAPVLSLAPSCRIPTVVGEILIGVVIGQTGLRWVDPTDPTFTFLAQVGFALVMFVVGSHVPVRDPALRRGLAVGLGRAAAIGVLAAPVGFVVARAFGTGHGGVYAVLMASSSAALIMPALAGVPTSAPAMVRLLPQIAVADAACIVALPLVIDPPNAGRAAIGAAAIIAAGAVLAVLLRYLVASDREKRLRSMSKRHQLALELRISLGLIFALAAMATRLHVSVMLAGFVVGVAVSAAGEPHRLAGQLFALTEGLFAPLFFIWLGASLNIRELDRHPSGILLGLVLGLGAIAVHGAMVITRQRWPMAIVTSAQMGVPVSAVALGTASDLLRPGEAAAILLGALVTVAATTAVSAKVRDIALEPAARPDGG